MVTELSKFFSGNKPWQLWMKTIIKLKVSLMMETEMISKTLGFYPQLILLVAWEEFLEFLWFISAV